MSATKMRYTVCRCSSRKLKIVCVKHFCGERILQVGKLIDELASELVILKFNSLILIMGISVILFTSAFLHCVLNYIHI